METARGVRFETFSITYSYSEMLINLSTYIHEYGRFWLCMHFHHFVYTKLKNTHTPGKKTKRVCLSSNFKRLLFFSLFVSKENKLKSENQGRGEHREKKPVAKTSTFALCSHTHSLCICS